MNIDYKYALRIRENINYLSTATWRRRLKNYGRPLKVSSKDITRTMMLKTIGAWQPEQCHVWLSASHLIQCITSDSVHRIRLSVLLLIQQLIFISATDVRPNDWCLTEWLMFDPVTDVWPNDWCLTDQWTIRSQQSVLYSITTKCSNGSNKRTANITRNNTTRSRLPCY